MNETLVTLKGHNSYSGVVEHKKYIIEIFTKYRLIKTGDQAALLALYDSEKSSLNQFGQCKSDELDIFIEIRSNVVTCMYSQGRYSEAITEGIRNIEEIDKCEDSIKANWRLVNLINIGYSKYSKGEFKDAIEWLNRAQSLDPKDERITQTLAKCKKRLNNKKGKYFIIPGLILIGASFIFDDELSFYQRVSIDVLAISLLTVPVIVNRIRK